MLQTVPPVGLNLQVARYDFLEHRWWTPAVEDRRDVPV